MGRTGLKNLGNTCYMNSMLQCLANSEPLVRFYLLDSYLTQINKESTYGSKGVLSRAFSELLQQLYLGSKPSVSPWGVKNAIGNIDIRFKGFVQNDSQELLGCLLDTLHEDVNQVTKKPLVELKDSDGRADQEVADEYWQGHLQRE